MRILHVGKYYHPHRGGMETVLREVAEGLIERGADVRVLAAGRPGGDGGSLALGRGRLLRASTWGVMNSQPLTPDLPGMLHRELRDFAPDIVHLHFPNPLAALAWRLAAGRRRAGTRLAVWHHADIVRQRWGRFVAGPVQQSCLRRAAGIVVSSAAFAASSCELARHRARVTVIPFGIDPAPWSAREPTGDGPFLFVGRLVAYKGLAVLLQALREVGGARLAVVGDGPAGTRLRRMARKLGVADRVEWLGEIRRDDLAARLAGARALVLPSVDASETFGLVQLEAMAAGVPVVATDLPTGVREIAAPASHLLVPPGDAPALAAALAELAADPLLAARMGAAGRERMRAGFTRARMVADLLAWYEQLSPAGKE